MVRVFCFTLLLLGSQLSASASDLNVSTEGEFRSYNQILVSQIHHVKDVLSKQLKSELACDSVKLCIMSIKKTGFLGLGKKLFQLKLTASCKQSFSSFKLEFAPAFDWEESSFVKYSYHLNGNGQVERVLDLGRSPYGADTSDKIAELPICY